MKRKINSQIWSPLAGIRGKITTNGTRDQLASQPSPLINSQMKRFMVFRSDSKPTQSGLNPPHGQIPLLD